MFDCASVMYYPSSNIDEESVVFVTYPGKYNQYLYGWLIYFRIDSQCHLYSDTSNDSMPKHPPSPASIDSYSMETTESTAFYETHLLPGQLTFGPNGQLQQICKRLEGKKSNER